MPCTCTAITTAVVVLSCVAIAAGITIIVCGAVVVREYVLNKDFKGTDCRVRAVEYLNGTIPCRHCWTTGGGRVKITHCVDSSFPCVQVLTEYVSGKTNDTQIGILHPTGVQAKEFPKCSYNVCEKDPKQSVKRVEDFAKEWRARINGTKFVCYYDVKQPTVLLYEKKFGESAVIHSMLWPGLVFVCCIMAIIFLCTTRSAAMLGKKGGASIAVYSNPPQMATLAVDQSRYGPAYNVYPPVSDQYHQPPPGYSSVYPPAPTGALKY